MIKQNPQPQTIHLQSRNRLPLARSVLGTTTMVEYAKTLGIAPDKFLDAIAIRLEDLNNHEMLITLDQELQAIKRFIELIPDPLLGLKVGKLYNISANMKVSIPAIFSSTFLECIGFTFRYLGLTLSLFQYELDVRGDMAIMTGKELADFGEIRRFICERELIGIYYNLHSSLGFALPLKELRVAYPRPDYAAGYQDIIQCPIIFNADEHQLFFESSYLYKRLPMANALAKEAFEKECEKEYARLREWGTNLARIRQELLYHKEGFPSFEQLARLLNVSSRTLRRRLIAEGTTYKKLVSEIRMTKAFELLKTTNYPIEKIATNLGYSEVPNFYHAFKSWTGMTPCDYRKHNL